MNKLIKNTVSSLLIYAAVLLLNFVISRLVLVSYGSETNGLLSSVGQIFNYIALLEAGIGTATINGLYAALAKQDDNAVADVLAASRAYYRRATLWYLICVAVASFVWPLVIESDLPKTTITALILFQGVSGAINFWSVSTIANYLVASGRNYANNNVHLIATALTCVLKMVVCSLKMNVIFMSVTLVVVSGVKALCCALYMKRICPEYSSKRKGDFSLLKQKNAFLVHEISGVIFSSTDTIVIAVFCGLTEASIYTTYSLVFLALNAVIGQVFSGTAYILGNNYAEDKEKYKRVHNAYNSVYIYGVFVVFTTAYLLTLPFISLYTSGVSDANYMDPKLPLLFALVQLLSACRMVDSNLIRISIHAKQTISRTITETVINLVVSLILVHYIGIYGVLIGTIVALLYRTNDTIIYGNRKILNRSPAKEYKTVILNFLIFAAFVYLRRYIAIEVTSYLEWIGYAIITTIGVVVIYGLPNCLAHKEEIKRGIALLKAKKQTD